MAERVVELRTELKDALRFRCLTGTEELGLPFAYRVEVLADTPRWRSRSCWAPASA